MKIQGLFGSEYSSFKISTTGRVPDIAKLVGGARLDYRLEPHFLEEMCLGRLRVSAVFSGWDAVCVCFFTKQNPTRSRQNGPIEKVRRHQVS